MREEERAAAEAAQEEALALEPEITVDDLEDSLTHEADAQEAKREHSEDEQRVQDIRAGIAELFEDGWTTGELMAFSRDEGVRNAIAAGHSVPRAAAAWLRGMATGEGTAPVDLPVQRRRHGVPTTRATAAAAAIPDNRIEQMTDAQFDAFSRRARAAMIAGKRVRL